MGRSTDPDPHAEHDEFSDEYWWNRPWTRRRTILAYFFVGWVGAVVIMVVGDHRLRHRWPTWLELGDYILIGIVVAPIVAVGGWLMSAPTRRGIRRDDGTDRSLSGPGDGD